MQWTWILLFDQFKYLIICTDISRVLQIWFCKFDCGHDSFWCMFLCTPVNPSSRVPSGVPPTSSTNFLPRYYYLQLALQHAATHRFSRIENSLAVGLTQVNPYLLAKQTNLSEANALTKKIGVNGRSLSVVWCTSLWDWRYWLMLLLLLPKK